MNYSVLSKYRSELMGLAMLWVMAFHAFDLDFGIGVVNWIRAAGFGGVDIFIVMSALGLVSSLSRRAEEYGSFLKRRGERILPAYFVVMAPYTLFLMSQARADWGTLVMNSTLLYYWTKPAGAFNWYVAGIMLFYAIAPFCFGRLRRSKRPFVLTLSAVAAGLVICRIFLNNGKYWGYLDIFYRLPVFFLGLLVGLYVRDKRKLGWRDGLFWLFWLALGLGYLYLAYTVDVNVIYLPLCHLFLFTTVPLCFVFCWFFERLPLGWLRRGLRVVGENSLEIYLFNVSIFAEVALLRQLFGFGEGDNRYYLIAFPLNLALGVLLHRAVEWGRTCFAKEENHG